MCRTGFRQEHRYMAAPVLDVEPRSVPLGARPRQPASVTGWVTLDAGPAQFARFLLVGGLANLVYAGLFLMSTGLGDQAANALGVVASTALANELHRRLTFRASDRVGWATAQWTGSGLAVTGLAGSSLMLAALDEGTVSSGPLLSVLAVCAVNGTVGLARFVGLRWFLALRPVTA